MRMDHDRTSLSCGTPFTGPTQSRDRGQDFGNGGVPVKRFCAQQLIRRRGFFDILGAGPGFCRDLRLRSLGYMLRFVVSEAAANMMLVRCNSDVPIS